MNRRNFLSNSAKLMLVTSGLFITGSLVSSCHNDDDDGGYSGGYYDGGYYDDRPGRNEEETSNTKAKQ